MISTLLTVAVSLASLSYGSALPNRRDSGILRLPITTVHTDATNLSIFHKRQSVSQVENVQTGTRYMIELSVGTPPQAISLQLDTGSSETYVNPTCSAAGAADNVALCAIFPQYSTTASTSAKDLGTSNKLSYGLGVANVEYYTDNFLLGGSTVTAQKFGVTTSSSDLPTGLLGVGPGLELVGYPIIVDTLASQGITNSRAFSLDLRSIESPDGAIIFGGIDTMKYSGALEKCPIIPAASAPDSYNRYWIHMSSLGITKPGEASKTYASSSSDPAGQPVFLDSGGTVSRLPGTLVDAIVADFPGAIEDGNSGLYLVDCALGLQDGTLDFGFGKTTIRVPYTDFFWHIQGVCYLGVTASESSFVLGDSFLRAAFVVFDQDNQNLHVAQADNCGTNLVAIGKGVDAVPSIVGACGASSTSSSSSSIATSTSSTVSVLPTITSSSVSGFPTLSVASNVPYPMANATSYGAGPTGTGYGTGYPTGTGAISYTTKTMYSTSSYTSNGVVTKTIVGVTTVCPVTAKSTSHATKYSTKTVYATHTYKDTSGAVVTRTISQGTTVCPVTAAPTSYSTGYRTSTIYATTTYTISKCAAGVANCPYGMTTTEQVPVSTSIHPYVNIYVGGSVWSPATLVANPVPVAPSAATPASYVANTVPTAPAASTITTAVVVPVAYPTAASAVTPVTPVGTGYSTGTGPIPTGVFVPASAASKTSSFWVAGVVGLVLMAMM